jgi:hypothetical protein
MFVRLGHNVLPLLVAFATNPTVVLAGPLVQLKHSMTDTASRLVMLLMSCLLMTPWVAALAPPVGSPWDATVVNPPVLGNTS